MKNLLYTLSLLVAFSLSAQSLQNHPSETLLAELEPVKTVKAVEVDEPEMAAFDFDTADYLPQGFDAYKGMIIDETSLLVEEAITFDFDTEKYLPEGFDAYSGMFLADNIIEEEDAEFDFDINKYLPKDFDPLKKFYPGQESNFEICEIYPSL